MVALRVAGVEYPLVMTVGAMDVLAQMGQTIDTLVDYISPAKHPFPVAVDHGLEVLEVFAQAGAERRRLHGGADASTPDFGIVRQALTPAEVLGLCDAAIVEGITRRVEADHEKNGESVGDGSR